MMGNTIVLVEAKRGGVYSYTAAPFPILVKTTPITIDSDPLLIDAEEVYTT